MSDELPLFAHWSQFLSWLLHATLKFPKRVRFTFSSRIDNLALDILELIIEARYSREKQTLLKQINLKLEKLRILLRLCYESQYLSLNSYEYACRELLRAGEMTGGWLKQQAKSS